MSRPQPKERSYSYTQGKKDYEECLAAYREEYHRARAADPRSIEGLPNPDDDSRGFDPSEALQRLRSTPRGLKTDPPRDVQS